MDAIEENINWYFHDFSNQPRSLLCGNEKKSIRNYVYYYVISNEPWSNFSKDIDLLYNIIQTSWVLSYAGNIVGFEYCYYFIQGGALHVHDVSITSLSWVVANVTYRDNCYMCKDANNDISFHFFSKVPFNPGMIVWPNLIVITRAFL